MVMERSRILRQRLLRRMKMMMTMVDLMAPVARKVTIN
jgi:hypothetical protein